MKLLVGGGSGFIGKHLRKLAESKGHEMVNVTRQSRSVQDITWMSLERNGLPEDVDSVLNLSGVNIMSPVRWTEAFKKELLDSRVETTKLLVNAVRAADSKPSSFIAISAIGYYGSEDEGLDVTEDSPAGDDYAARLCKKWEAAAALEETDIRKVTVRIGLAMGRDGGMVSSMYWPFFFGVGGNISDGKQWFPWIHVDDVAGIILHSIENPDISGALNAVAPDSVTNSQFTTSFSRQMWRFAPFPVPKFALRTLLGEDRADMLASSPKILPVRTLASGYKYTYPDLASACADATKWC